MLVRLRVRSKKTREPWNYMQNGQKRSGMNREQAINYLFSCGFTNEQVGEVVRALTYEPTTKNDSSELEKNSKKLEKNFGELDCISRAEALNCLKATELKKFDWIIDAREKISNLPSVTPQPRWIPISERLPEDSQFVLMTIRRIGEHYNHEPFISVGYISWNQTAWWCAHDGDCKSHDVIVDAWMPLPKPYEPQESEE
jgi:hypothetical protein